MKIFQPIVLAIIILSAAGTFDVNCCAQESLPGAALEHSVYAAKVQSPVSEHRTESDQTSQSRTPHSIDFPALLVPDENDAAATEPLGDTMAGPVVTTVSALLVVLAVFGILVWGSKRFGSSRDSAGSLPADVFQNLGSTAIDAKMRVTFLKVGERILVIGQSPTGDARTLSEITDPDEVVRLTNRCLGRPEIVGRRERFAHATDASLRDLAAG